jgi:hypothetical protein
LHEHERGDGPNPTCAASPFLTGWIAFVDTNQSGQRDAGELVLLQHEAMNTQITARSSVDPMRVTYLMSGFALNPNAARLVLCDERGNTPPAASSRRPGHPRFRHRTRGRFPGCRRDPDSPDCDRYRRRRV